MLEEIYARDQLLALILRSEFESEGIEFFTPSHFSQQLGYMNRPKGYTITPHVHNVVNRDVELTQEVLFIKSGSVKMDIFDLDKKFIKSCILNKGDVVLLASGGHGFTMLEKSEIIEVKTGPHLGEIDKTRFNEN
jgi:hypothetical protein